MNTKCFTMIMSLGCLMMSCSDYENSPATANEADHYLTVSDMSHVGHLHNEMLTAIVSDFDTVSDSIEKAGERGLLVFADYVDGKLAELCPQLVSQGISGKKYASLVLPGVVRHYATETSTTRSSLNAIQIIQQMQYVAVSDTLDLDSIAPFDDIVVAYRANGILSSRGSIYLNDIFNAIKLHMGGRISATQFQQVIEQISDDFDMELYPTDSDEGMFIASVLSVADSSAVWWASHPEQHPGVQQAAPAALDAAGAFLSGVSGIVNGSFSWGSVVTGAALTSAGAAYKVVSTATKIARWFKSLF